MTILSCVFSGLDHYLPCTGGGCWLDLSLENHSSLQPLIRAERSGRRTNLFRILPLTFVWGEVFKCHRRHQSPVLSLLHTGRNWQWTKRSLIPVRILSPGLICSTEFFILSLFFVANFTQLCFYSIIQIPDQHSHVIQDKNNLEHHCRLGLSG